MRIFIILLSLAASLLCTGCQSGTVTLPRLPGWQQPTDTRMIGAFEVRVNASVILPGVPVLAADDSFTLVSKAWLDEYLVWTWRAAAAAGVRYTLESFDCENFAILFDSLAALAASKAGVRAAPLLARLVVQLDPQHRHELIGVATDQGLFVVEPQPDAGPFRVWPLETYTKPILSVVLGDYNP